MNYRERLKVFKEELKLIGKKPVRDFVRECIRKVPDYVFTNCPSSSTGKFHPIEELGPDGTILHTKKVFAVAYELSRGLDCEHHRDEICAAALLHDMTKQGFKRSGHTRKNHPQTMAKLVADVYKENSCNMSKESFYIIYNGIFYHYGPWTSDAVSKPVKDFSMEELAVYVADYISSKRFVHVDARRKLMEG